MDDDTESPRGQYPLTRPEAGLSRTPSWVMLGFILGALFVYALMRRDAAEKPVVTVQMLPPEKPAPRERVLLSTIEAVFAVWGEHATWSGDTTEVALWSKEEKAYADCYEVRRVDGNLYFRSIPGLTRRIIRHGKELPGSPLQFTETEEQYREWLEHGRRERPPEVAPPPRVRPPDQP